MRQGLRGAFASESLAVRGGELVYKTPQQFGRSGSECVKAVVKAQKERGRVVGIE
jgi:hypothetical protein